MAWQSIAKIIGQAFSWIEEWRKNRKYRRLRKFGRIKMEMMKLDRKMDSLKNFKTRADSITYAKLLKRKRLLEKRIIGMAC